MGHLTHTASAVWRFYRDGFRSMTVGRTLWWLILLKLFVLFAILRVFFFQPHLRGKTEEQRQEYVGNELSNRRTAGYEAPGPETDY